MGNPLKNKTALITGGSRGIGAAIVKRLAKEGANIALTYSKSPDQAKKVIDVAKAFGVKAIAIKADSANASDLAVAVDRTAKELGGVDILINNSGVLSLGPVDSFSIEDFDRTVAVNVR